VQVGGDGDFAADLLMGVPSCRWRLDARSGSRRSRTVVAQPTAGGVGGSAIIAAASAAHRSAGRHPRLRWVLALATTNHVASRSLKSAGEVNDRPGRNEVSK
jgi:hypothetical protein